MTDLPNPLSHAYLLTGGSGESRAALIQRMTAAYLCQGERPPCGRCAPCRKAAAAIWARFFPPVGRKCRSLTASPCAPFAGVTVSSSARVTDCITI